MGFRGTILQQIICTLYCVFTIQSLVFFHHHLSCLPFICPHTPFPLGITILLSASMRVFLCLIPSPILPSSPALLPSDSCQSVFMSVFLFCLFFHWIPHISEIIWYLSFSDWLISLSVIPSRSIHAATKGKISFFLWPNSILLWKCTSLSFFYPLIY